MVVPGGKAVSSERGTPVVPVTWLCWSSTARERRDTAPLCHPRWPTILKLTCWDCGTNPSNLERNRVRARNLVVLEPRWPTTNLHRNRCRAKMAHIRQSRPDSGRVTWLCWSSTARERRDTQPLRAPIRAEGSMPCEQHDLLLAHPLF